LRREKGPLTSPQKKNSNLGERYVFVDKTRELLVLGDKKKHFDNKKVYAATSGRFSAGISAISSH
jgi:hypothetical protein